MSQHFANNTPADLGVGVHIMDGDFCLDASLNPLWAEGSAPRDKRVSEHTTMLAGSLARWRVVCVVLCTFGCGRMCAVRTYVTYYYYVCVRSCVCVRVLVCVCARMPVPARARVCLCACVCARARTYTHTHLYVCVYV